MLKSIWNYFKGYVIIEITGFSIERFLNLTLHKGILVYNLEETQKGVSCKINIKDFKKLREFAKKTGCKYKIKIKYGAPFFIQKNRKRKPFVFGIFLFIFILYFLSSFVWHIEIIGNNLIDNNSILKFCSEKELYLGSYKRKIDLKSLQGDLKNEFDEISWVNISLKGTKITIKISENIKKNEIMQNEEPCNIIAEEDGIITEIVTKKGTPILKEKDVFKKGDIIVSGEIILKEGEEIKGSYLTKADADIRGKVLEEINIEVPFNYKIKQYTKKSKKEYYLIAFNKVFSLNLIKPKISYENYDKFTSRTQLKLSENFLLPFIIVKNEYKEYEKVDKKYSLEEAKKYANKLITEEIISKIDFSSDILENEIIYKEFNNKIIANAKVTLIKNIGKKEPIIQVERGTENGTNEITN